MNEHDSVKITGLLAGLGFTPTDSIEAASLILFNTCTIRQKAHDKAFSEIGKAIVLKRDLLPGENHQVTNRPIIAVCGCVAQEEGAKLLHRFPEIDLVFGPDQIYKLPELLATVAETKKPAVACDLINSSEDYHFLDASNAIRLNGPCAFVTIMKGCNSHCSYCIVPAVRGSEVYRPAREIIREIDWLVQKGCKEATLLGQNVNSYPDFAKLLRLIAENTDVARIRFISPHPKDVKDDLMEEYATNPKLCSHIHLPLQSGADSVLRRMRRAYNTTTYREKVRRLRQARPDLAISTDLIVGFPQESDEEFQRSIDFIREIEFDSIFSFQYSVRAGTEAATMADDVHSNVKRERLLTLQHLQDEIAERKNRAHVGRDYEVLVDGCDQRGKGRLRGRISQNKLVNFAGQSGAIGAIVKVQIKSVSASSLAGEEVTNGSQ